MHRLAVVYLLTRVEVSCVRVSTLQYIVVIDTCVVEVSFLHMRVSAIKYIVIDTR